MERARRIVVCARSLSEGRALSGFLEHDVGLEVVGVFDTAKEMLPKLAELDPNLVLVDLEAVAPSEIEQMREMPVPVATLVPPGQENSVRLGEALGAGALEAIPEDRFHLDDPEGVWATALRSRVKRLASIRLKGSATPGPSVPAPSRAWRRPGASYCAVGIGASVGGPPALAAVLGGLPPDFPLPVLVVQHMAAGFGGGLAKWLDQSVPLPVALADDGASLRPGVWLAPDGAHLRLEPSMTLALDRTTSRGAHRPSLDVLFESLASSIGKEAVGVVLTGMGRDGAEGIRAIDEAGGLTIAQDEETSAVFGMPGAAIEAGVDLVVPLQDLAPRLAGLRAGRAAR